MGSPVSVVRDLFEALKVPEGFLLSSLAAIRTGCSLVRSDEYSILKKVLGSLFPP